MCEQLKTLVSEKFTPQILEEILRKKTGFWNPTVKSIAFGDETKKGESYLSVVTRFMVEICDEDGGNVDAVQRVHIITKAFPKNLARRITFRSVDFFKNEIAFYKTVWPKLDEFQKTKKLKNPLTIIPECLSSYSDGENDYIAMEDLTYDGYSSMERNSLLNFDQAVEIIELFGKFHGLSIAFNDQNPGDFAKTADALSESYFDLKFRNWYTPVMNKMMWVMRDAVQKELNENYVKKFDELLKLDLYRLVCEICKDHSHLCGIAHGDCWAPNFLTKYDDDNRFCVKIIDYQLTRCASVVTDLTFFLYVCVEQEVVESRWDDIIKAYVNSVSNFLISLGSKSDLISVEGVEESMKKVGLFTFVMNAEALVMSCLEEEDVVDMDEIKEVTTIDNVWIIKLIQNEEKRKRVAWFFKHLVDGQYI